MTADSKRETNHTARYLKSKLLTTPKLKFNVKYRSTIENTWQEWTNQAFQLKL